MEFRVYFKHMASSLATYAYAEKKLGQRLEKFALRGVEARLTFAVQRDGFQAACHIIADDGIDIALETTDGVSMTAAIDGLADKLDERLRRARQKVRARRARAKPSVFSYQQVTSLEDAMDAGEVLEFERARRQAMPPTGAATAMRQKPQPSLAVRRVMHVVQ